MTNIGNYGNKDSSFSKPKSKGDCSVESGRSPEPEQSPEPRVPEQCQDNNHVLTHSLNDNVSNYDYVNSLGNYDFLSSENFNACIDNVCRSVIKSNQNVGQIMNDLDEKVCPSTINQSEDISLAVIKANDNVCPSICKLENNVCSSVTQGNENCNISKSKLCKQSCTAVSSCDEIVISGTSRLVPLEKYSNFKFLLNVTAKVFQFINILKSKINSKRSDNFLRCYDNDVLYKKAYNHIISTEQKIVFLIYISSLILKMGTLKIFLT